MNWNDALDATHGYHAEDIVLRVREATEKVVRGEAAFERDGVLFEKYQPPFPLIAALLRVAVANRDRLNVLDYGGSLGSSYYQCRPFLENLQELQWTIVEQHDFVKTGRKYFQNDTLHFCSTLDECVRKTVPTVILFSGVLQYLEQYLTVIESAVSFGARSIIIDRTPVVALPESRLARQVVPKHLGSASYPVRLFNREHLLAPFFPSYRLISEYDAVDDVMSYGLTRIDFKGFILDKVPG